MKEKLPEEADQWAHLALTGKHSPDIFERVDRASRLMEVPTHQIVESALIRILDELEPHLQRIEKIKSGDRGERNETK